MKAPSLLGARIALWWAMIYTRHADPAVARDRCEELYADLHEQVQLGLSYGMSRGALSRAVLGRTVRGVPADLLWRADVEWSRDRLRSVVSEPAVVFGVLFAVLVPVTLLADISRRLRGVPELLVDGLTCSRPLSTRSPLRTSSRQR